MMGWNWARVLPLALVLSALAACGGGEEEGQPQGACPDGYELVNGACQREGDDNAQNNAQNAGGPCDDDGDCFRGRVCEQGECVDPAGENNANNPNNSDPNNGNNPNNSDPNNNNPDNNGNNSNNSNNNPNNNGNNNNPDNNANNGGNNAGGPCQSDEECEAGQECAEGVCITPDREGPKLVNAFASDGRVTLRFDEPIAEAGAEELGNFTIQGSDNSTLRVTGAQHDGRFVHLTLDPGAQINAQLTYEVLASNLQDLAGNPLDRAANRKTIKQALYLNIIWHQHQPLYHDPVKDQMIGPWVRKHAAKSYYDMTDMVREQPDIHFNVNLTSVLLIQLELYLQRLGPFVDTDANTVDEEAFLAAWRGKTDPFVDFLLDETPAPPFTEEQVEMIHRGSWTLVSTSNPIMARFPEYEVLRDKARDSYTQLDAAKLKVWFELAWFDPDFLQPGGVRLATGKVVDLSDVLEPLPGGNLPGSKYRLRSAYTSGSEAQQLEALEALSNRLVAEEYKVMEAVIPLHRELLYDADTREGKIEVMTTPFYHPILPLVYDTNQARPGQPGDPLPSPNYSFPDDAYAQIARAVRYFTDTFGQPPRGMWPGEGSVAEVVVGSFAENGIEWIATDARVLERSQPSNQRLFFPYKVDGDTAQGTGGQTDDETMIVFRDGPLSDKIGFAYQTLDGEVASDDFINGVVQNAPNFGQPDRLLTVILDGENAWESYTKEHDGKGFLRSMYRKLQQAYDQGEIVTVTASEYIHGNLDRGVPAHPITSQRELEPLWPGSWIDGSFSTWIGETEENIGWTYLLRARQDLASSGIPRPNPSLPEPRDQESFAYYAYRAWEAIYAAEGSDWFWWFGADQETPGNDDTGFDRAFRSHLNATYRFMNLALCERRATQGDPCEEGEEPIVAPNFAPIIQPRAEGLRGAFEAGQEPEIDGGFDPDETEWNVAAGSFFDNDSGAINNPNDDVKIVYYGYVGEEDGDDEDDYLYLAIDSNDDLSTKEGTDYEFRVYLTHKHITNPDLGQFEEDPSNATTRSGDTIQFIGDGPAREIAVDLTTVPARARLSYADGRGGWQEQPNDIEVGGAVQGGRVIELRIPLTDLGLQLGDPVEFAVQAVQAGQVLDVAPNLGSRIVFDDITNLIFVSFFLDVSGDINRYVQIRNAPAPQGTGTVYITGNQPSLEDFVPNSVAMRNDGTAPDERASDAVWSRTFGFRPGIELRYKYTIGTPQDFGRWPNTEEFPLTERGFRIPTPDECPSKKLVIRDRFADRPQPSGSFGPNSSMTCVEE